MSLLRQHPETKEYFLATSKKCPQEAVAPLPPKYNPDDKYGKYRREAKRRQGLL